MNYLAHLALAGGHDPALLAGGFLGDFVKGRLRGERPVALERGIALHRHLDARSNLDADIAASGARLAVPRRYAGPLVDVLADHLLALEFERWEGESLDTFADRSVARLGQWQAFFPPAADAFYVRLIEYDVLRAYRDPDTIVRVAGVLATRLRQPALQHAAALALERELPALQDDFAGYYPRLRAAARGWLDGRAS